MIDRNISGLWKGQGKRVRKTSSPIIGFVYRGQDKFFGKEVEGVLLEIFDENDEAVLKTREDKFISVDKRSLKIVAS